MGCAAKGHVRPKVRSCTHACVIARLDPAPHTKAPPREGAANGYPRPLSTYPVLIGVRQCLLDFGLPRHCARRCAATMSKGRCGSGPTMLNCRWVLAANVNRSPRQTAATREAPAAVWRRAGGVVGRFYPSAVMLIEPDPFSRSRLDPVPRVTPFLASCGQALGPEARVQR
jgi:hypothetical protein